MSTFGFKSPTPNIARSADDTITGTPLDWILNQQPVSSLLSQQLLDVRHRDLPQQVVQSIARAEDDTGENASTDCIKLLVCKSAPIIWGMQRAVFESIDGKSKNEAVDAANDNGDEATHTRNKANTINEYFKYLPGVDEFKQHGDGCEDRYSGCKIFT